MITKPALINLASDAMNAYNTLMKFSKCLLGVALFATVTLISTSVVQAQDPHARVSFITSGDFTGGISPESYITYIGDGETVTKEVPWSTFPLFNFLIDVGSSDTFSSSGDPESIAISDPNELVVQGDIITLNTEATSRTGDVTYTITSSVHAGFSATFVLRLSRAPQLITFAEQNDDGLVYMGDPLFLVATSSSDLPVSFQLVNLPTIPSSSRALLVDNLATGTNNLLYPEYGAGFVRIRAVQAGNTDYAPATSVDQEVFIDRAQQRVRFNPANIIPPIEDITHGNFPFMVSATAYRISSRNVREHGQHPLDNLPIDSSDAPVSFRVYSGPAYINDGSNIVVPVGYGQVFVQGIQQLTSTLTNDDDNDGIADLGSGDDNNDGVVDFYSATWLESFTIQETNTSSGAQFLDQWEWKSPVGTVGTNYNEIAYGNGRMVVVGDGGRVMTSEARPPFTPASDPYEWTLQASGVTDDMSAVVRGLGRFVAVGTGGQIWTSADGVGAWTATTIPGATNLTDIAFNSATNTYIVVGEGGYIATGANPLDGTSFTQQNSQLDAGITLNAVTVVDFVPPNAAPLTINYLYVAVGTDGSITTSPNGVAWTAQRYGTTFDFNDVVQHAPIPDDEPATPNDTGVAGSPIVIVGENGLILTSSNGINWSTSYTNDNINLTSIASFLYQEPTTDDSFGNTPRVFVNVFVAVGENGKVVTSRDGINWSERNSRYPFTFNHIIYDTELGFFAAVGDQFTIFASPNGEVWNLMDAAEDEDLNAVAFGNGSYVAVGDDGLILRSTDGETWTEVPLANLPVAAQSQSFFGVTFGGPLDSLNSPINQFVAVGSGNTIILSNDGLTWTAATSIPAMPMGDFLGIAFSGSRYVVAAGGFGLLSSADGNNWTRHTAGSNTHITSVTYSKTVGNFAAVGTFGAILLSSDGVNWFDVFSGTNVNLTGVTYSELDGLYVAVGEGGLILTSEYGDAWTVQESGTQFDLNAITYVPDENKEDGGTYVAVGNNFQVVTSRDGIQWSAQVTGILSALNGVGHGNGLIVAVGDYRSIITTRNAIPSGLDTWTLNSPQIDGVPGVNGLLFANNVHVAVGDTGLVLTSTDGLNWTQQTTGTTEDLKSIAYGNGRFVVVGGNAVLTSTNGVNWTQQTAITQQTWHEQLNYVTFGAGRFVAVGDGGLITSSSDGVNWILSNGFVGAPIGKTIAPNIYGITYGAGLFVAVGATTDTDLDCFGIKVFNMTFLAYSFDSVTWFRMYAPIIGIDSSRCPIYMTSTMRGITYGNNTFMAVGDNQTVLTFNPPQTVKSVVTGDLVSYASDFNRVLRATGQLNSVAYGSAQGIPRFTIVGNNGTVMTTLTGDIFELRYPGVFDNLNAVIYGKNGFLVGGDNGRILDSATGESWRNIRSAGAIGRFNDVAYGNQTLVLVGDAGTIYTSVDGKNWTPRTSGITANINGVAFKPGTNSLFLGVADNGLAVYSSNSGATWQSSASIVTSRLNEAIYFPAASRFIVVGNNGVTLTTTDGISWQIPSTSVTSRLNSVAVSADTAVVVGSNGTILTSPATAIAWTVRTSGTANEINSVTYGQTDTGANLFVAVGTLGLILTSPDGIAWTPANPGSLTNTNLLNVHYGNGQFVASGTGGIVLTSLDGQTWRTRPSASISSLNSGLYADGVHVLAGNFGTVLNSGILSPKLDQTVVFPAINDVAVTGKLESITLGATASSGLPVSYSLADTNQGNFVSVLGNVVRVDTSQVTESDQVVIVARQPGNSTYNPAPLVTQSFFVVPLNHKAGLVFSLPSPQVYAPNKTVTLTAQSLTLDDEPTGLTTEAVISSNSANVSVTGNTMTLLGAGTATISVTIAGGINANNERFSPATAEFTYEITKASQTIASLPINNNARFYRGDTPVNLNTTASSGLTLAVTKTSDANSAVEIVNGVMNFVRAGSVTLRFEQAGNENYLAADPVTRTFTVLDTPPGNLWAASASNTTQSLNSVNFANNTFLVAGTSTTILNSIPQANSESLTWTRRTSGATTLNDAIYAVDSFYAVGTNSVLLQSANGNQWNSVTIAGLTQTLNALASNFVNAIAVGDGGIILKGGASSVPWATVSSGITQNINDVVYFQSATDSSKNAYYAVTDGGFVLKSLDGNTWTSASVSTANLLGIACGYTGSGGNKEDLLVIVGDSSTILTSVDGSNWIARTSPVARLNAVTFGTDGSVDRNGRFLAVGNSGVVVTSQNGEEWVSQTSNTTQDLFGVAYTDSLYVAVGANGTIITSGAFEAKSTQFTGFADAALPAITFGNTAATLSPATSFTKVNNNDVSTGLNNRFAIVSGPARIIENNKIEATGAGAVSVLAYQEGNSQFYPAPAVVRTLSVAKANQEIKFFANGANSSNQVLASAFGAPRLDIFANDGDPTNDLSIGGLALKPASYRQGSTEATGLPISGTVTGPGGFVRETLTDGTEVVYLVITGEGTITITLNQTGSVDYNAAASKTITVNVIGVFPTVSFAQPANNSTFTTNLPVLLQVFAADTGIGAGISNVTFAANGSNLGTATRLANTGLFYLNTWRPGVPGVYNVVATATDLNGNATSASITVNAVSATSNPPSIALNAPSSAILGSTVELSANAFDSDGVVTSVEYFSNGVLIGSANFSPYKLDWQPSNVGNFLLHAIATDNTGNRVSTPPSLVTINNNAAPLVSFVYPTASNGGLNFELGSAIYLQVNATDSDGTIARVNFFDGQRLIGTATTAPYSAILTPDQIRAYSIRAVAIDDRGISSSASAMIVIDAPAGEAPEVAMLIPHTGETLTASSTLLLEAFAYSSNLSSVQIYVNGSLRDGVTSPVAYYYNNRFRPGLAGVYNVFAVATDGAGNRISSFPLTLTATGSAGVAPNISFTAPANVLVGQTRTITVSASDPDGSVTGVQFYVDGELLGADTASPYQFTWRPSEARNYQLLAVATDNRGNVNYTNTSVVNVVDGNSPTVSITGPSGNAVTVNTPVVLTATASDGSEGPIASLQFFVNNVAIGGLLTSEPFQTNWTPAVSGSYVIRAVATDSQGATGEATKTITAATAGVSPVITFPYKAPSDNNPVKTSFVLGETVFLRAAVSDTDGYVTEVQFLDGNTALSPVINPASNEALYQWTPSQVGTYNISVVAKDNAGNTTQTNGVQFVITSPGPYNIVFTSPVSPVPSPENPDGIPQIKLGSDAILEVSVQAGTDRVLRQVQFFANNRLIGEDTAAPYTIVWRPESQGTQILLAVSTDIAGVVSTTTKTVSVLAADENDSPPSLSLSITADGNITENSRVVITANVDDEDINILNGSVDPEFELTFYLNGEKINNTDMIGKFAAVIQPVALSDVVTDPNYRNYEVRAVAEDSAGNTRAVILNKVYVARQFVSTPIVTVSQFATPLNLGIATKISATLRGSGQSDTTVIFYANGFEIGSDATAPYEINWTPDLYPGMKLDENITISAVAVRPAIQFDIDPDFNNTEIVDCSPVSVSNRVEVLLTKDTSTATPTVEILTPTSNESFTAGTTIQLTANAAIVSDGAAGSLTTIRQVVYYDSTSPDASIAELETKTPIGSSSVAAGNYSVAYPIPQRDATVYLFAIATATNDNKVRSAAVPINVSTGPLPTITSFTSDVTGSTFLGLPITFTVVAEDAKGIAAVEFRRALRGTEDQVTVLGYDFASPYSIIYQTDRSLAPGTYVFTVRVVNGATPQKEKISESIIINLDLPNPLGSGSEFTDDFVYQTMNDLLFRIPTVNELNNYDSILSYDSSKGRESIISAILKLDDYKPVRRTILANMLLRGWIPGSYDLFVDTQLLRTQSLNYLIEQYESDLLVNLKRVYGDSAVLPDKDTPELQFQQMITYLWNLKYRSNTTSLDNVPGMSAANYASLYNSFRLFGRTNFLSLWVQDVNNITFGNGTITPALNLTNVPNNFAHERAQIAGLFVGLLAQIPTDDEFAAYMRIPLIDRIKGVLADPRYAARFTTTSFDGYILSNTWKYSNWFGLYYDGFRPWVYHIENGWLFEATNSTQSMWLYSVDEGAWLWTNIYYYPWVWSAAQSNGGWLQLAE